MGHAWTTRFDGQSLEFATGVTSARHATAGGVGPGGRSVSLPLQMRSVPVSRHSHGDYQCRPRTETEHRFGRTRPKEADLVILAANPLVSAQNTERIEIVIKAGQALIVEAARTGQVRRWKRMRERDCGVPNPHLVTAATYRYGNTR